MVYFLAKKGKEKNYRDEGVKHSKKSALGMPSPPASTSEDKGGCKNFCFPLYLKRFRSVLFSRKKTIRDLNQHSLHSSEEAGLSRKGLSYLRI